MCSSLEMFLARTSLALQQTVLSPQAAVARPGAPGRAREVTGWWWQTGAPAPSPSQRCGSVCGQHRVCARRLRAHVVWPSATLPGHLCPNPPPAAPSRRLRGSPRAPSGGWQGAGGLPRRVKEQEHVRRCCRNAFWIQLLVTGENHKEVIKAMCDKLGFTPNLGIGVWGVSFFFSCRTERGAHLLFIHCHPAFCTTVHAFWNT